MWIEHTKGTRVCTMIEIKCPRCAQYWYIDDADDDGGGRVRLCSRCKDQIRLKRGHRAEVDIPFLIGVGLAVVFDLMMIALTALVPRIFGKVMLGISIFMLIAGWAIFRVLQWEGGLSGWLFPFAGNIDWRIGRWAMLIFLSGFVCLLAYGSLVGFKH